MGYGPFQGTVPTPEVVDTNLSQGISLILLSFPRFIIGGLARFKESAPYGHAGNFKNSFLLCSDEFPLNFLTLVSYIAFFQKWRPRMN